MRNERRAPEIGNRTYQQQLAENLIRSLGMNGAVDVCFQNDWTGTLEVIIKKDPSVPCQETA